MTMGPMIILAGGKTGGHLYPGIALAEELRDRGCSVLFVGSRGGLEEREIPRRGFPLEIITVGGLKGKSFGETLKNLLLLPAALARSWSIIGHHHAHAVVSLGGFAAGPVALAAKLRGRKVFVLEQNTIPGITNRLVGRFADRIFTSFPDDAGRFDARRVSYTGNPVRREVLDISPASLPNEGRPVLAVFGGSQGAHSLNELMMCLTRDHAAIAGRFFIVHQTGQQDVDTVRTHYEACGVPALVRPFLTDIGAYYKAADLVICRAGATTIAELLALGKRAIYVPFPHAADDHQYHNARSVAARGGGAVVRDVGSVAEKAERLAAAIAELDGLPTTPASDGVSPVDAVKRIADEMCRPVDGGAV